METIYPLVAVVGQEQAKKALLIALVNQKAGGLLIGGAKGTAKSVLARSCEELAGGRSLLTLPLNVTEDMLFGSIDIEYAVSLGEKRFSPGLLARATDNILYIDEANLLRQELLTAVLDANSAGVNNVERDGISCSHAVRTTIIATMNPEEGTLPPHILDRFGMYVDVQALKDVQERVEVMQRALAYSRNILDFRRRYAEETQQLAAKLAAARELLPQVMASDAMLMLAAQLCAQAYCAGHRAELYLLEAARALAALAGRSYVLPKDIEEAAQFVLPHRMRKPPEQQSEEPEQQEDNQSEDDSEQDEEQQSDNEQDNDTESQLSPPLDSGEDDNDAADESEDDDKSREEDEQQKEQDNSNFAPEEQLADIDKTFRLPKLLLDFGKDRNVRRGSGKRSVTKTDLKQGRYVRAEQPKGKVSDLAFDATIRAAAPYQRLREDNGCALNIKEEDLRQKVREKRVGNTFLFAVDASGSMGARERMRAVKGAIFYMLQEAYQKRDRVGMIAFRRDKADLLLPITRSVDLAQKRLAEMPTGGKTPLADGLALSLQTLALLNKRDSELEPILIVVTDGRANAVHEGEKEPVAAAINIAEKIAKAKITSVVIDTESDFIKLGIAKKLAATMQANYYTLQRLSKENIIHIVRNLH
ncbi:VWA domain-containing protein [uncultured Phascolarctobacterium sp.]|uniref:VWA domain-containing protein n=1 Tax=uncultured Phascolarctobacterium sp. TaxID=512296 RepID=UPI0025F9978D|nr:VWA domain-containing protein [uncultured Phascolarctobacterium sp.]